MLSAVPLIQAGALVLVWILFTLWCFRKVLTRERASAQQSSATLLVAYASEGGAAESIAQRLTESLHQQGREAQLLTLNQVTSARLIKAKTLLVVTSTYGAGEAPDNGRFFLPELTSNSPELSNLSYSILGLGDTEYEHFCGFALALNTALEKCGATTLAPLVEVDKLHPVAIDLWLDQLIEHGLLTRRPVLDSQTQRIHSARLIGRRHLNPGSPGAPVFEVNFAPHDAFEWRAGDIAQLHLDGQMREYSIASTQNEGVLKFLVREQTSANGELGLGSGWLCKHAELQSESQFSVRSNPSFHCPDHRPDHCSDDCPDAAQKLILIGNGSGLAGLRAHLKERESNKQHDNWLIYGERSPHTDRHWDETLSDWLEIGHLTYLDRSFSRAGDTDLSSVVGNAYPGYVQNVVDYQAERLAQWLSEGAIIMVCGSRDGMASDLDQRLQTLLGAEAVAQLSADGRYRRDVY